ncbi:MAG: vWA domain-containing protein [Candidatus Sumerlaeaceae bacterium]
MYANRLLASFAIITHLLCSTCGFAQQEAVSQQDVIRLLELKIPEAQIIERVKSAGTVFVLGQTDIERLKKAGASETLLAAMGASASGKSSDSGIAISDATTAEISDLAIVVDYSGSMNAKTPDGILKVDAAKKAFEALVDKLPKDLRVSLVVYGTDKQRGCEDIDIVQPLADLDRDSLKKLGTSFEAKGMTPIAASLEKAAETLTGSKGGRSIVLITDGAESCKGDPAQVAQRLARQYGVSFALHVIGFDLKPEEKQALEQVAIAGRGRYFNADSSAQLTEAMQKVTVAVAKATPKPSPKPEPTATPEPTPRDSRAFSAGGQELKGGAWFHDATEVKPGEYKGGLSLKEIRFYKMPVQKGQELRAIGQFKKFPLPGDPYYDQPMGQDFIVTVYDPGLNPVAREFVETKDNPTAPVTTRASWTADSDGMAWVSVAASQNYKPGSKAWAENSGLKDVQPSDYTLRIKVEGEVAQAGAVTAPANLTVKSGTGFDNAGAISGNGMITEDIKFDETVFYSVAVQKDQPVELTLAAQKPWEARDHYYFPQKATYTITLYDDDQVEVAKETLDIKGNPPDAYSKALNWTATIGGKAYISLSLTNTATNAKSNSAEPGAGHFSLLVSTGASEAKQPGTAAGTAPASTPEASPASSDKPADKTAEPADKSATPGPERKPVDPFSGAETK